MKYLPFLATSLLLTLSLAAADKIEGAFGLKLGDVFSPPKIERDAKQNASGNGYPFTPDKANRVFSEYFVYITPISHRIYRIMAFATFPDGRHGYELSEAVAALLNRKYGEPIKTIGQVVQNNRIVGMTNDSSGPEGVTFHVTYEDTEIARLAENERMDAVIKDLDTTGL